MLKYYELNKKPTSKETAAFQGDGIEHTLVTAGLIAATVRIEIDVRYRLRNAEAAADKRIAIRVNSCHECRIRWIQPDHRWSVAEVWFRWIETLWVKFYNKKY